MKAGDTVEIVGGPCHRADGLKDPHRGTYHVLRGTSKSTLCQCTVCGRTTPAPKFWTLGNRKRGGTWGRDERYLRLVPPLEELIEKDEEAHA